MTIVRTPLLRHVAPYRMARPEMSTAAEPTSGDAGCPSPAIRCAARDAAGEVPTLRCRHAAQARRYRSLPPHGHAPSRAQTFTTR